VKFLWVEDSHRFILFDENENELFSISEEQKRSIIARFKYYTEEYSNEKISTEEMKQLAETIMEEDTEIKIPQNSFLEIKITDRSSDFPSELLFLSAGCSPEQSIKVFRQFNQNYQRENNFLLPDITFIKSENPDKLQCLFFEEVHVRSWLKNGFYCSFPQINEQPVEKIKDILETNQIVHFAGHVQAGESGDAKFLIDGEKDLWLHSKDVDKLSKYPFFVWMNGCGSANGNKNSWAWFFLNRGVRCFIGATNNLSDKFAEEAAEVFYKRIVYGDSAGKAFLTTRKEMLQQGCFETFNLRFFGDFNFKIKRAK
jgi:hypothetical protein